MDFIKEYKKEILSASFALTIGAYALSRYKVALPSEYLALTGPGISNVKVAKKAVQWPFQTVSVIDMTPMTYELHISAMSTDKQDMGLPITFSIGPGTDVESQTKYATLLGGCPDVMKVVNGFIEPEARSIAANLTIEEIFKNRMAFREKVQESVQEDLNSFGLKVWQSGIREIEDDKTRKDGTKYFHYLRLIKSSEAEQTARKSVAELEFKGDITVKEKERDTRMQSALYEANAVETESTAKIDIARHLAALEVEEAKFRMQSQLAKIEAEKAAMLREADLQREVENRRIAQFTERQRSEVMSKVTVESESMERMAQAYLVSAQKQAEGKLAMSKAEAEGIQMKYAAQAEGLQKLKESLGSAEMLLSHEMIQNGTYEKIASSNAAAVQNMKPVITSWTTDGSSDGMSDIAKKLVPLLSIVSKQTGIEPPTWLAQMPNKKN